MLSALLSLFLILFEVLQDVSCMPLKTESLELQKEFPEKYFNAFGYFETGPPFYDPPYRPVSLLPFDLEYINTTFLLFSHSNPLTPIALKFDEDSLSKASFNTDLETKVIIHGYSVDLKEDDAIYMMKNAFLQTGNYNVIIVNWTDSNQPPYAQAVANARVVAAQLAFLIETLKLSLDLRPGSVHLIGHSMGAHLAGWTGKRTEGLGRISGLDPAGPYFHVADPRVRLDAEDAIFVDTIVTNGGSNYLEGIGLNEAIGDINFYPNGGAKQPGCENISPEDSPYDGYDPYLNGCSHMRAIYLFIFSIQNESCRFWGTSCPNYEAFVRGDCSGRSTRIKSKTSTPVKIQMGHNAVKPRFSSRGQIFFLETSASPPFCLQ